MNNVTVQLVKQKICIESDATFNGASTRTIAYATVELNEGFIIDEISIRQCLDNKADIRVIFPFKKVHDKVIYYVKFPSEQVKKEVTLEILNRVRQAMDRSLFFSEDISPVK